MNRSTAARAVVVALVVSGAPASPRAGLAEGWYLARGRANLEIANYAAAVEAFKKALEHDPGNREASRSLGIALQRNGETDAAVAQYGRHLERFPDDAEIAFALARVLQWSRYAYRSADAVRYLRLGLRSREDPARRRELARLLARDPATRDEAVESYRRLLAAAPGDAALREEYLKLLLWDRRRRGEAIAELERRTAEAPGDERLSRELARLLAEDPRRADEAARRYAALVAAHPDDPELRLGRARALARLGRRDEALVDYGRAVAARPAWIDARVEQADLLAAEPEGREAARRAYEGVLREAPGNRRARVGLARVLGARKETAPDAIRAYEAVLREAPRDAEAHGGLARAYAWEGDPDRALVHAAAARRLGPDRADLAALTQALREGREPALGGGVRVLSQLGAGASALERVGGLVQGELEPTPFTRAESEVGWAEARGPAGARAAGAIAAGALTVRPGDEVRLRLGLSWDGLRLGGRLGGEVGLARPLDAGELALRAVRQARTDSYRAYAGERLAGGGLAGGASESYAEVRLRRGGDATFEVAARAGAIDAEGTPATLLAGASARAGRILLGGPRFGLGVALAGVALHHGRRLDAGALDGRGPGLFSPPALRERVSPAHARARRGDGRMALGRRGALGPVDGGPGRSGAPGGRCRALRGVAPRRAAAALRRAAGRARRRGLHPVRGVGLAGGAVPVSAARCTTLAALVASPRPAAEALAIGAALARAVEELHRAGEVHGALHPGAAELGAEGVVVLAAAPAAGAPLAPERAPALPFAAPEVLRGSRPGRPADVFSTAAVIHALLAGSPPFGAGEPLAIVHRILYGRPVRAGALPPGPDRAGQAALAAALSRRPRRRPTARVLAAALERALESGAPHAAAPHAAAPHAAAPHAAAPHAAAPHAAVPHADAPAGRPRRATALARAAAARVRAALPPLPPFPRPPRLRAAGALGVIGAAALLFAAIGAFVLGGGMGLRSRVEALVARGELARARQLLEAAGPDDDPVVEKLRGDLACAEGRPADCLRRYRAALGGRPELRADGFVRANTVRLLDGAQPCAVRRAAALLLVEVRDPAALPALERARRSAGLLAIFCEGDALDRALVATRAEARQPR
ncbi:MAG: tetratricopeptide repeat protein [Anaeromyxobacteraceae bacterium]